MDCPNVIKLELHQNPDKPAEWAVSFLYDEKGEDGDIVRTGTHEDMSRLFNICNPIISNTNYELACDIIKRYE